MDLTKLKKKHVLKIPTNIDVIYCKKKKILTFLGPLQKKSLTIKTQIFIIKSKNLIIVTNYSFEKTSNINMQNLKSIQGTTVAKIKQILIEISYTLQKKLIFVGVGYRAIQLDSDESKLYFKLGYSHLIYFKIPQPLNVVCIRFTKIFIFGNSSFEDINRTAALIRNCRLPEPYKGKGILYNNEKITLKKGKKI